MQKELSNFESSISDRFGPVPTIVQDLFTTIRLRWKAQEIGFEKLVVKSQKMIGYFIADSSHSYFQGPVFTQVLNYIQTNPPNCKMSEKDEKLRLIYSKVQSLDQALELISEIMETSLAN